MQFCAHPLWGGFSWPKRYTAIDLDMVSQRWRPVFFIVLALLAIWLVALAGYRIAKSTKMTAEKVKAYAASVDLSKLTGDARARALQDVVSQP